MKSVVQGNTNRAFFPYGTPNRSSGRTEKLPQEAWKFPATPAARRKRKAEDVDADVVQASKKAKTEEPKQKPESEGLKVQQPAEQSNLDVSIKAVQSCSNDPHPAPKIIEIRKNKSPQKIKKATTGFDRFREGGLFYSNVPAGKSAGYARPPIPLFPKESAGSVDGAVDRKDTSDAQRPYQASSNGKVNVGGLAKSPESAFPHQKPSTVPDVWTTSNVSNVGDQSISNQTTASAKRKKTAAATSAEIRSWVSSKPTKIPGPKDIGSCDKWRLPGTDTKLLPVHLTSVLKWKTREPMSAADRDIVNAALATRKK